MSLDSPSTVQVGGDHYKKFDYQPVHFLMDINCNTALGYAIKYVSRYPNKNPDDLDKAVHCLDLYGEWVCNRVVDMDYLPDQAMLDFLKIQEFTSQFEPKVIKAINAILVLASISSLISKETELFQHLDFHDKLLTAKYLIEELKNED